MSFILLFFILSFIISISIITIIPTTLANHAYAELSSTDKNSSLIGKSLDGNSVETINKDVMQIKNQNNVSDKMKELKSASNNTVVSKNQDKNETSLFI